MNEVLDLLDRVSWIDGPGWLLGSVVAAAIFVPLFVRYFPKDWL